MGLGAAALSGLVAAALLAFLPETRPDRPAGPSPRWRIGHPAALGPGAVLAVVAVGYTSISAFAPLFARHIGMRSSGPLYATFALTILVVRLVSGRLADRHGRAVIAFPGLVSCVVGMFLLAVFPVPVAAFVGVALFANGHALIFPALMALTVDRISEDERGEALGSFTACFDVGAAVGGYAVGFVADQAGFGAAWATPGVLCLLGMIVLANLARKEAVLRREHADEAPPLEPAGA